MKVVILAGGLGTRLSEETDSIPKPMVRIGDKPILWHIMKTYSQYGFDEFVICLGFKGQIIKEFFCNYRTYSSDFTIDLDTMNVEIHNDYRESWKVTMIDTGDTTMTGGRIKRIAEYLEGETFLMTYGDGLSNVNIHELVQFHRAHGRLATVTSVSQPGRFGCLTVADDNVTGFVEKPHDDNLLVNGGFFVLEPSVIDYIDGDHSIWEKEPMEGLVRDAQLMSFWHQGFWQPMDTLREKRLLDQLWATGKPPWKIW